MKKIFLVSQVTLKEVFRTKILNGLIGLSFVLLVLIYIASEFAYGAPEKVALDIGFGILSLSNMAIAIFLGSTLLSKEIESKTLYMIISKPITRNGFLIGKLLGLSSVLILNTIFLSSITIGLFLFLGGAFSSLMLWCAFFILLESLLLLSVSVTFSLISNSTLTVFYSIFFLIAGHNINETKKIIFTKISKLFSFILESAQFIIPDLERFNLKDFLIYRQSLSMNYYFVNIGYAFLVIGFFVLISSYLFSIKNLD